MGFKLSFNTISFVLILISFVFLLLATISSPIVTIFNLGKTSSHTYGVFGYCTNNNNDCSSATYPIKFSSIDDNSKNWIMSSSTRDTLGKIFILTPIALGFNFILLVLIFISHFGLKPVVLIGIAVNVIAAILTIISCIITILVFHPNLAWTGWILIGAAAATLISLVFMILTLTVTGSNDDDDDNDSNDTGFGRFTNNKYDKLDDKFNHIQTSTFKSPNSTSSMDNDYDYKPYGSNNNGLYGKQNNGYGNGNTGYTPTNGSNNGLAGAAGTTAGAAAASAYGINKSFNGPPATSSNVNGSFTSNSSSYYTKPQTANDFTQRQNNGSGTSLRNINNPNYNSSNPPYPATINNGQPNNPNTDGNSTFSRSVFEHHPQVEGHKPFTELDDDFEDEEDEINNRGGTNIIVTTNDSDEDSDFTSVSQRAPNPQYNQFPQQQHPQQNNYYNTYSNVQQYQPISQQQQQVPHQLPNQPQQAQYPQNYSTSSSQYVTSPNSYTSNQYFQQNQSPHQHHQQPPLQQRPTISDNVLNNNPDFNFSRNLQIQQKQQQKRRISPGFVPVAARYNNNTNSTNANVSSLMGRNGGTQARSGPYGITR
ncbi:uncharacterized protein KGF55_005623 [Candida pseudojiufengensis]|uniref:uncharacterized protein n=1 Tax=Candida pseudojiufengensis TaxID=497109 RepID=UPI002224600B|nr:uncharacterized protein KGF55_005623 [Candida pseudojiufengensis]KAI5958969.1 hypothetical protein KGF55_005623 [Candida pseudojiufengensis]